MADYLAYAYVETSLEDLVASTCAHKLFHVIQEYHSLHGIGDVSEQSFVEAQATAIQEVVVPTANDYLEPALDFLFAPDSMAFFQRTYDAGIFRVYVTDRFGLRATLDLMNSSALYDGHYAIDHAFAPLGLSFFDVWANFAVLLATGSLLDSEVIAMLVLDAVRDFDCLAAGCIRVAHSHRHYAIRTRNRAVHPRHSARRVNSRLLFVFNPKPASKRSTT